MNKFSVIRPAVFAVAAGGVLSLSGLGIASATASPAPQHAAAVRSTAAVTGGIIVYEKTLVNQHIVLGSQSHPTTMTTKAVPAGKYLVTGTVTADSQPGSFLVCSLSSTENGNDGVFGVYTNQTSLGAQASIYETEVVTVAAGQSIHLTCDDNNAKSGDVAGSAVIEATPVNSLH